MKKKYYTKSGFAIKLQIDSVDRLYRTSTNDFEIYEKYIKDLDWKEFNKAKKDLDKMAKIEEWKTNQNLKENK